MLGRKFFLVTAVIFLLGLAGGWMLHGRSAQKEEIKNTGATPRVNAGDRNSRPGDTSAKEAAPPQSPSGEANSGEEKKPAAAAPGTSPKSAPAPAPPAEKATSAGTAREEAAPPQPSDGGDGSRRSQIEQKYNSRLQSLASGYEARLNGLVSAALAEYSAAKKADPNADVGPLVNKYYAAGKSLEAECDSQFYAVLSAFENELSSNSLPLDAAARASEAYEARKSARAGEITGGR